MLHDDRDLFEQVILRTSEDMGIDAAIVEKDYYVTLFLKEIVKEQPNIIFKGGTSLSKCYKLVERFSEDIDLNIETENKPTEGQRKRLKASILSVINSFGFNLVNADDVRSRRAYNKYIVDYPSVFDARCLKENLIIETAVYIKAYPTKRMMASSLIYEYLVKIGFEDFIVQYGLQPFELNVQTAERTLIDKVFALGDYYLDDNIAEHSRHIYDIYKLLNVVELSTDLKNLVKVVKAERKVHSTCLSAQDQIDIKALLTEIVNRKIYKEDYQTITENLLFEKVDYETAVIALQQIIDSGIMD